MEAIRFFDKFEQELIGILNRQMNTSVTMALVSCVTTSN
jgi:hypothetical protein